MRNMFTVRHTTYDLRGTHMQASLEQQPMDYTL